MYRIAVFCGSAAGTRPEYTVAARTLGQMLAEQGYGIVYGGASIGLMREVADGALRAGGEVIGVIPRSLLQKEIAHPDITKLHVVESMHERKALMADLAHAFVALPGGYGTLDELCEIVTWAQIGIHAKPVVLLNVAHYFDSFLEFTAVAESEGFVRPAHRGLLKIETSVAALVAALPNRLAPLP